MRWQVAHDLGQLFRYMAGLGKGPWKAGITTAYCSVGRRVVATMNPGESGEPKSGVQSSEDAIRATPPIHDMALDRLIAS